LTFRTQGQAAESFEEYDGTVGSQYQGKRFLRLKSFRLVCLPVSRFFHQLFKS
jgi:hypothetical protein